MNFDDTTDEAAFRREARQWLEANAERRDGPGGAFLDIFEHRDGDEERDWLKRCRAWQHTKYQGGYGAVTVPPEWGGRGGTAIEEAIFEQEEAAFDVATGAFGITLNMIAPTVLAHGVEEQRDGVRRMLCGDEIWCQLFSEPGAGSDLAGLQTRAVADGSDWVVNGQKVWTSGAHYADHGYLIARTDPAAPKHKGLTAFLLPMGQEGVTVRPLRQMTGGAHFNEVFFDEVRIPDSDRLGDVGGGWRVLLTTLANERGMANGFEAGPRLRDALVALARERDLAADPGVRQELAALHTAVELGRFTSYRALTAMSQGRPLGPEVAGAKLSLTRMLARMGALAGHLAGPDLTLGGDWADLLCGVPGIRIAGGTDEILHNILGERVLGLPPEPRPVPA